MVDPQIYNRVFERDNDGKAILEELTRLFYDRPSYSKGDSHETAFREGQRSAIAYILNKAGQIYTEGQSNGNDQTQT